jgi:serine/threonine protein kinase
MDDFPVSRWNQRSTRLHSGFATVEQNTTCIQGRHHEHRDGLACLQVRRPSVVLLVYLGEDLVTRMLQWCEDSLVSWPGMWTPQVCSSNDFSALVFELLGPNLEDLLRYCGNRFSLKTTLMLADQLLRPLEALRAHYYLHRDIKPKNFLLGSTIGRQGNVFYLTDLSLAVHRRPDQWDYSRIDSRAELPARPPKLLGTCRCASINGHLDVGK